MTTRQKQVFEMLAKGLSQNQIAEVLEISKKRVGAHIYNYKVKNGYETTLQAAVSLARQKLI